MLEGPAPELGGKAEKVIRYPSRRRMRELAEQCHASDHPLQSLPWLPPIFGNSFSQDSLDEYKTATAFITLDGADFFMILEERVRLDDLLRRKKRYANETGDCHFPATNML